MAEDYPDDLTTLDGIIHALYDSISGSAEQQRDVVRFRSLFADAARLIATRPDAETGERRMIVMEVDEYFRTACEYFKIEGFFEREVARRAEAFGHVTHVFSTYESRRAPGAAPFSRGINSIQLFNDGTRYRIVNILWDYERPDNPIPAQYLPR